MQIYSETNTVKNRNMMKNPIWQEADQLAQYLQA